MNQCIYYWFTECNLASIEIVIWLRLMIINISKNLFPTIESTNNGPCNQNTTRRCPQPTHKRRIRPRPNLVWTVKLFQCSWYSTQLSLQIMPFEPKYTRTTFVQLHDWWDENVPQKRKTLQKHKKNKQLTRKNENENLNVTIWGDSFNKTKRWQLAGLKTAKLNELVRLHCQSEHSFQNRWFKKEVRNSKFRKIQSKLQKRAWNFELWNYIVYK